MLINSLQSWFEFGGSALGVRVVVEPDIDVLAGCEFRPIVWLPDFGATMGTLVFEGNFSRSKLPERAHAAGYTASYMGTINKSFEFSADDFIEVLSDWGWTSCQQPRPDWLKES
jgi:hypothetical protein